MVDDHVPNLNAAEAAIRELLPETTVHKFTTPDAVIEALNTGAPPIDVVFSDMVMHGDRLTGHKIACVSWSWNIPATVVSGGHKGHGHNIVHVGQPDMMLEGDKDDPEVWKKIIENVLVDMKPYNGIVMALRFIPRLQAPDRQHGETCAIACIP